MIIDTSKAFVIAEIGVNHNGDITIAKKLIDKAIESGANAVKFQSFKADSLVTMDTPKVPYQMQTTNPEESHYEMIKKLELSDDDHLLLKRYCDEKNILFTSTPYDIVSAKLLNDIINVPFFKTASADIVDIPLHEYIASTGKMALVATGMASLGEVERVVNIYRKSGTELVLLHCVSNYPCSDLSLNLNAIKSMSASFGVPVGYSDHSEGSVAAVLSVALGARVFEKHFTLSKSMEGPDHKASATPDELKELIQGVNRAMHMLGSPIKKVQDEEILMRNISRKSLSYLKEFEIGHKFSAEDFTMLRPGDGLNYDMLNFFIDRKAKIKIKKNSHAKIQDIL